METWRFRAKAVTKYNPQNYNSEGIYTLDEWTSYSDIGTEIDSVTNTTLTKERYLEVENNYINAVKTFIADVNAKKIKLTELYKVADFKRKNNIDLYEYYSNLESKEYDITEIDSIAKLALREYIQVAIQLITPKMDSTIYFGYDYYMYFVSDSINFNNLQKK